MKGKNVKDKERNLNINLKNLKFFTLVKGLSIYLSKIFDLKATSQNPKRFTDRPFSYTKPPLLFCALTFTRQEMNTHALNPPCFIMKMKHHNFNN
jgi:hypothetical protein